MKSSIITASLTLFTSLSLFAQQTPSGTTSTPIRNRPSIGVKVGANVTNLVGKQSNATDLDNSPTTSYTAGVNLEVPIGSSMFVQPGLTFSKKGFENKAGNNEIKINYVEVPVNFVYKPMLGTGNVLLGFGPYVAWGVGGKEEDDVNGNERKIVFADSFNPSDTRFQVKKMDAGANFLAGYEFANKLSFQLNAQLGLVNIKPEITGDETSKWKNSGFGITAGYRF